MTKVQNTLLLFFYFLSIRLNLQISGTRSRQNQVPFRKVFATPTSHVSGTLGIQLRGKHDFVINNDCDKIKIIIK